MDKEQKDRILKLLDEAVVRLDNLQREIAEERERERKQEALNSKAVLIVYGLLILVFFVLNQCGK